MQPLTWLIQGDTGSELGDTIIITIIIVVIIVIVIVIVIIIIILVTIMIVIVMIWIKKRDLYPRHMGLAGDTGSELVPGERSLKILHLLHLNLKFEAEERKSK